MFSIMDRAMSLGKKYDAAEAFIIKTVTNAVYIDGSKVSNVETKTDMGISFRLYADGKIGKASVTLNSDDDVDLCAKMAAEVARYSPPTKDFKGYPMPEVKRVSPKGMWDDKIENISPEDLTYIAQSIIDFCDTEIPRGLLRVSTVISDVANTNGLTTEHAGTTLYGHFTSMTRKEHPGEGVETLFGTSLNVEPETLGESLKKKADAAASAKPFKGRKKLTMILPPSELGDMILSSAGSALNGENVMYGRSLWKDKIDQNVASESITLMDDPESPAPLCSAFDDEGTPATRKLLVENGILKSFMRDSFVGDSTGNGLRRSTVESQGIYENPVSIKPMNLVLTPGRYSQEDIIASTKDGIFVEKFAWPEADSLTGRFGLEVRSGYIIKDGKIVETINNALLMGNMITALENVEMIGNDSINMGPVTIPTVSFSGMELIGN